MRFVVLGPVEVHANDGRVLTLPRRQERCLLAILLLEVGRVVPTPRLAELMWDDEPPDLATRGLASMVSRIRAMLTRAGATEDGVALRSYGGGYLLQASPETVDAHQFRRLLDAAGNTGELSERERLLRSALALWRGPALGGAASDGVRRRLCADLDKLHLQAIEEAAATALNLGRHGGVLPELARLVGEHPANERLAELYMLALHRAGRTADALDVYARTRTHLARELGLDPGSALRRLQQSILRGESGVPPAAPPRPAVVGRAPAQLPRDLSAFAGRTGELRQLDDLCAGGDARPGMVIAAITGPAGIGKTALAVHWAHGVRDWFPDGQLYANLAGFDPVADPVAPVDVIRRFLTALDVSPQRIPADPEAQIGLYRTLLAAKRVLVVLDNARDPDQVRPLLPGSAGCFVLVTSRHRLTGLVAVDAAHPLALDLLSTDEANELLTGRIGAERVAAEPDAAAILIAACARLPLSLAIAAAQAATRPGVPLATITADIRAARTALDAFTGDDTATDIRAVFASSYRAVSPPAARLFRLLGTHPGPDISAAAAASLAGLPRLAVEPLLRELSDAHLLTEAAPGRYTFHDLLRAYAAELVQAHEAGEEHRTALHRTLDHYLHTADRAVQLTQPHSDPVDLPPALPGVTPEGLTDRDEAAVWLTDEHRVLMAAIQHAADHGFDVHALHLALRLTGFLDYRCHWSDLEAVQDMAIAAAHRLGDQPAQARAHRDLAVAYARLGRYDEAHSNFRQALDICAELRDHVGRAHIHRLRGWLLESQRRYEDALDDARKALDGYRGAGHRNGEAATLNLIGWYHSLLGDYWQGVTYCEQALATHQSLGNRRGEAADWDSLGYAEYHLGDQQRAITCYRHALRLRRELGDTYNEAVVLTHLGDVHEASEDIEAARTAWQQALAILDELDHADAAQVRHKLAATAGV
jgi:DNA-binding SARP family transcriptional activator/tetratricopeptide (TPR) repeat protein